VTGGFLRRSISIGDVLLKAGLALSVFLIMGLTAVDVFARYLFSAPLDGAYEMVSILMALTIFLALPLVGRHNEHIGVDLAQGMLRGRFVRIHWAVMRFIEAAVIVVIATRLWVLADLMRHAGQVTGFLEWPLAPLAYVMSVLAVVAAVVTALEATRPPRLPPEPAEHIRER
jgi:TRAP-type transport system small permease protein